jgi:hypothetical protein
VTAIPKAPEGTKEAGLKLWRAVLTRYDLEEHEVTLLGQACRVADLCADLQKHIDDYGLMVSGSKRVRLRPAVAELRQQRLTLARLIVALRVPIGDQEEDPAKSGTPRLQRRGGTRGFYAISGGRDA